MVHPKNTYQQNLIHEQSWYDADPSCLWETNAIWKNYPENPKSKFITLACLRSHLQDSGTHEEWAHADFPMAANRLQKEDR
jgi:hypothetical protein